MREIGLTQITRILIFSLFFTGLQCSLLPKRAVKSLEENEPIYTGSLLAVYARNVPPGYISIQPYLVGTNSYGHYKSNGSFQGSHNNYSLALLTFIEAGITQKLDIKFSFGQEYAYFQGNNAFRNRDTHLWFGYQALLNQKGTWIPDLRFLVGERFPTGKYKNLDPKFDGGDSTGNGAFQTPFILVARKIFYVFPEHPFNFNLNLFYILSSRAKVSGFNTYGGGFGTRGKVKPGNQFIANLAFELSITQSWEFVFDVRYRYQESSPFFGEPGLNKKGEIAKVGLPSSYLLSLAPGVGYNFSEIFALDWGIWFSVAGKNKEAFLGGVGTMYYVF